MPDVFESKYSALDRLIREYETDSKTINEHTIIMENYPKVFTMTTASVFERLLKRKIEEFVLNPVNPLSTYPTINAKVSLNFDKGIDFVYGKMYAYTDKNTGVNVLDASNFYTLFGTTFKSEVETEFIGLLNDQIAYEDSYLAPLTLLIDIGSQEAVEQYAVRVDIKDQLSRCSFSDAERYFLEIKHRRNMVAHDYTQTFSDSFVDIRNFYYGAAVYVTALDHCLSRLKSS